ncbi:MAG: DUF4080 domain-containing protein [Clostridia bacterium]
MKTLLVSINSKYIHSSLAVWYLKASVTATNQNVQIIESTIKENKEKLIQNITDEKADLIAFSTYIWNVNYIESILPLIKKNNPEAVIVLGGPEVSYNCKEVFAKNKDVSYILSGEGEEVFPIFIDAIKNNLPTENIIGVNSPTHQNPPCTNNKEPQSPYTTEYLERLKGRISYIETSRGCPYSCSYCLSGRLCKIKFFSMDRVKKDIDLLSSSGTQTIKFIDRTFNCNPKRATEIIDYIIEKNPKYNGICYHFEMAGDIFTEELLDALKRADTGLIQIEVGVQSFNEDTLKEVNRKTNIETVMKNMKTLLSNKNIHIHMDLIAGLPKEDFESFKLSFNKLFELRPDMLQLGFLKLLHGSPMKEQDVGVFSDTAPYQIIENDYLSQRDLEKLSFVEDSLERLYNSGRFKFLLEKVLETGLEPFDLFLDFGEKYQAKYGTKLEDYCEWILEHFQKYIEKNRLFDLLKENWLMLNSSGKFPKCLDEHGMGRVLKELDKNPETKRKKAVRRSATYLKSTNEYIWVDYENKNLISGEYELKRLKC